MNYFKNWDFMRYLRLGMGVFIIITGIQLNDWMMVVLGLLFSAMPIFNMGCCGVTPCRTTHCETPKTKADSREIEEITYQEVK